MFVFLFLLAGPYPGRARADGAAFGIDHASWTHLLERYVDGDGRVAYRRLASEADADLRAYLALLAEARVESLPRRDQQAFWINAYNAMIVAAVLEGHSADGPWRRFRLFQSYRRKLAGVERSPDDVEHGILRPRFADPRTHFALVCASSSCPKLRREAYRGDRLDAQLDEQARAFLADPQRNRIDTRTGAVEISRIFEWFRADFESGGSSLAGTLAPYLDAAQTELLRRKPPTFLSYDWTLNAQQGQIP